MTANKREVLSYSQMETMINELERRPALVSGKTTGDVTKHALSTMWNEVAAIVSALPGCVVDGEALKKRFSQLRCRVKTKVANNKVETQRSGGKFKGQPLTPVEERIIQLVGQDSMCGNGESQDLAHSENHNSESTTSLTDPTSAQIELTKDISVSIGCWKGKKEIDSSNQYVDPGLALPNGSVQMTVVAGGNNDTLENSDGPSLLPVTEHSTFIIPEELTENSHTIGLIDNSFLNEHSSSRDNSPDEEQAISQKTIIGCKRKRKQPMTIEELKMKIMTEILETERIRKETEKIRQDKERYCKETERLRKWQLTQQCLKGGYGLPPPDFQ